MRVSIVAPLTPEQQQQQKKKKEQRVGLQQLSRLQEAYCTSSITILTISYITNTLVTQSEAYEFTQSDYKGQSRIINTVSLTVSHRKHTVYFNCSIVSRPKQRHQRKCHLKKAAVWKIQPQKCNVDYRQCKQTLLILCERRLYRVAETSTEISMLTN